MNQEALNLKQNLTRTSTKEDVFSWKTAPMVLREYCASYDIRLNSHIYDLVCCHLRLMLDKNEFFNLTSIRDPKRALVLHALDSLLFLQPILSIDDEIRFSKDESFLDLGTGGGFPGIPLVCALGSHAVLLDATRKKADACRYFINELGLNEYVSIVHSRAEEHAQSNRVSNHFPFVVARAVSSLDVLLEYSSPFLTKNGYAIFGKGLEHGVEYEHAELVAPIVGMKLYSHTTFELPEGYGHREFFVYKKVREPSIHLPRKNGFAKTRPLYSLR